MYAFTYHRPGTVRQAASLLAKQEEAKLLAGGRTLIPTMAAPGRTEASGRPVEDRRFERDRDDRALAHHRGDDAARRGRHLGGGEGEYPGLGRSRR